MDKIALNESSHKKACNEKNVIDVFKKGKSGYNNIKTFGILTAENPDSAETPIGANNKNMRNLSNDLKSGHVGFIRQKSHFQEGDENSYFLFNVNVSLLSYYAGQFQQTFFIYGELREDGTLNSQYWQKRYPKEPYNKARNPYVKSDEVNSYVDMAGIDENYSIIGNKFKYRLPFSIFERVDRKIEENMKLMYEDRRVNRPTIEWLINGVGYANYYNCGGVYRGIYGEIND